MQIKKLISLLLAIAMVFSLAACTNSSTNDNSQTSDASQSQTVDNADSTASDTDDSTKTEYPLTLETYFWMGQKVEQTYTKVPERVIACGGSMIDLMVYFGLEDKIIGVCRTDDPTELPEEYQSVRDNLPVLVELWPSEEEVIAAEADLIASAYGGLFYDDDLGTIDEINGRGTNIFNLTNMSCVAEGTPVTIDDYFSSLRAFAKIFDIQDEMEEFLAGQQAALDEIAGKASADEETPSVMVLTQFSYHVENDLYCNYASDAIVNDLIRLAGGEPVNIGEAGSNQVSKEAIVENDPDIIILRIEGDPEDAVANFMALPEFQSLSAVKNGKVVMISMTESLDNYGYSISGPANTVYDAIHSF